MKLSFVSRFAANRAGAGRFWLGLLVCGGLGFGSAGLAQAPATQEITTFHQFYTLKPGQMPADRPVRFRGVVLCYDLGWNQMYVHDGAETAYFNPQNFQARLEPGQLVEITGATTCRGGDLALTNLSLKVLGRAPLPTAKRLGVPQLGSDFGQWVETSGRVRVAETSLNRLALLIQDEGQKCLVYVMTPPGTNDFKWLVGSQVQIRGINASKVVDGRLDSASVFAPGMNQIAVLEAAKINPAQLPVSSIDALLNRELGSWTNNLVRVNGQVSAYKPGKYLIVKEPTGLIRAEVIQSTRVQPDERVHVWGFLTVLPNETVLKDAFFETVRPPRPDFTPALSGIHSQGSNAAVALTRIADVSKLRQEEAAQNIPVRLRGVVTFADPEWHNSFIQDQSGAIYADLNQWDVRAGQWVELTGVTDPGGFAPEIISTAVRVLGNTNLPSPAEVDLDDLADGHLDAHWVELEGVVRRVSAQWGHVTLSLMARKGRFQAIIPGFGGQPPPTGLIGALVSVQGACGSEFNARRQLSGITLHVPGMNQVKVLEPVPADPFTAKAVPIKSVATYDPTRPAGRWVKISGVVTLPVPGQGFFVQDGSGGIRVLTEQTNNVHRGDSVEVLGFPATGDFGPYLEEAVFHAKGTVASPAPKRVTAEQILLYGTNDASIVQMEARLLQNVPRSARPKLVLQDGPIIFTAHLEAQSQAQEIFALKAGSLLHLTGVCSIQGGESHQPEMFRLLLSGPADIALFKPPPWLTSRQTFWIFGGLAGVLGLTLAWINLLRREVRRRTRDLEAQMAERKRMQVQIEETHKELVVASRQAGMAEVATTVLHNVSNVLNSVNVSSSLMANRLRNSKAANLSKVVALLDEHAHDLGSFITRDPKGQQLPGYLAQLAGHLTDEHAAVLAELANLRKNIEHIKDIVIMQQSYAKVADVTETVKVTDLVEDALRLNTSALERHHFQLVREYEEHLPEITVQKHKALQVLVNLIRNARYACDESGRADKLMTVRACNGGDRVRIAIIDNGVGIPPENLGKIFSYGFTTRKDGHGFGLHSGAQAAKEMGGALLAHSDGPGRGATFTLELPLSSPGGTVASAAASPGDDTRLIETVENGDGSTALNPPREPA